MQNNVEDEMCWFDNDFLNMVMDIEKKPID